MDFLFFFFHFFFFFGGGGGGGGHVRIGQNENILAWQKCQIFFGVLDIPDIFCGKP